LIGKPNHFVVQGLEDYNKLDFDTLRFPRSSRERNDEYIQNEMSRVQLLFLRRRTDITAEKLSETQNRLTDMMKFDRLVITEEKTKLTKKRIKNMSRRAMEAACQV